MPSIRHVKGDEEGSADAHRRGDAKTDDKGKPVWRRATVKGNVRVKAYGDVDELNSTIGVVRALMRSWSKNIHLPIDGKRRYAGCRYVSVVGVRRASGSDSRTVPEPSSRRIGCLDPLDVKERMACQAPLAAGLG